MKLILMLEGNEQNTVRDDQGFATTAAKRKRYSIKGFRTFAWTPRSKTGLDCLICADFAQQRRSTYAPTGYMLSRTFVQLPYRGTSLIRKTPPVGPYSIPMPRALW